MSTSLYYQSTGDEQAKTILFLHGGGVAGWMWEPVVALLPDFHCLVPDLPEHGKSLAVRPYTMELAADQTAELIREKGHGGKAVVVGLSEGAQVVVQLLATAPDVIERAVVSSALLLPMPGRGWRLLSSPKMIAWMFRLSVPPFRNVDWWMRLNMKSAAAIPESFFPQYKATFQAMTESQFVNLLVANQQFRMPGNLEGVSAPTLALAGKLEYATMKESAQQLAAALPDGKARLIDLGNGASMASEHNWALNVPELFAQTVRNFIHDCELPDILIPFN